MKEEIWNPVIGYENLYEISNQGNIRSLGKFVNSKHGGKRWIPGRIMKTWICNNYETVGLYKSGKQHFIAIHILVAKAFIPNPDNLPCVNHKDENKLNNHVDNLEWCTYQYNNIYGNRLQKASLSMKGKNTDKIWITDGNVSIRVLPAEFETDYKSQGFRRGRTLK